MALGTTQRWRLPPWRFLAEYDGNFTKRKKKEKQMPLQEIWESIYCWRAESSLVTFARSFSPKFAQREILNVPQTNKKCLDHRESYQSLDILPKSKRGLADR